MRRKGRAMVAAAVGGMFLLGATAQSFAGPMNAAVPQAEEGLAPLVVQARHFPPPHGKQCLKWTRRWHSSLGMGHLRCVHWH